MNQLIKNLLKIDQEIKNLMEEREALMEELAYVADHGVAIEAPQPEEDLDLDLDFELPELDEDEDDISDLLI